jgi:hypothetical protein
MGDPSRRRQVDSGNPPTEAEGGFLLELQTRAAFSLTLGELDTSGVTVNHLCPFGRVAPG